MRRPPTTFALAILLPLLAGCAASTQTSAGRFSGDQRAVAQAVDDLSSAAAGHDARRICDRLFTSELKARVSTGGRTCQTAVGQQLDSTDSFIVRVQSVALATPASSATAVVKSARGARDHLDTLCLSKVGSGWRLAGLAPCPASPAATRTP